MSTPHAAHTNRHALAIMRAECSALNMRCDDESKGSEGFPFISNLIYAPGKFSLWPLSLTNQSTISDV